MEESRNLAPRLTHALWKRTLALFLGLIVAAPAIGQDDNPELQKFQGPWEVVELVENGKVIRADRIREMLPSGGRVHVIENAIIFRSPKDQKQHAKVFSIAPAKYPKRIDVGNAQGQKSQGIYQFDDGKLVICIADPDSSERPGEFSAEADSQRMLMVLKRATTVKKPTNTRPKPGPPATLKGLTDADVTRMLAGTWLLKDSAGSLYVTFRPDRTFNTVREYQELRLFHKSFVQTPISNGTWSVNNAQLTAHVDASKRIDRVNQLFTFSVRSISSKDMILVDRLGRVLRTPKVR